MLKKKLSAVILAGALVISSGIPAITSHASKSWPDSISVESRSAIVMVQETGTVLYEKNADEKHYPASITKILTALVALEHSKLDETVTYSEKAVSQSAGGTSSIWRDVNEKMTMEESLYGMMLESANECAWAIGEHVGGGDINVFLDMMNDKAKELGCKHSHFNNPNGLPDEDHWTCARDMALISRAAFANPEFAKITGTRTYTIPPTNKHDDPTYLNNHHCMLNFYKTSQYLYDYCVGGKTGYTVAAGNPLVTYAQKDGMTLIVVVLKSSKPAHWTDTIRLCDYFFDNYEVKNASDVTDLSPSEPSASFGKLSDGNTSLVKVGENDKIVLPKKAKKKKINYTIDSPAEDAPKDAVGTISYTYEDHDIGTATIYASESTAKAYPFHNMTAEEAAEGQEKTDEAKSAGSDFIQINVPLVIGLALAFIALVVLLTIIIRKLVIFGRQAARERKYTRTPKSHYREIRRDVGRRKRRRK